MHIYYNWHLHDGWVWVAWRWCGVPVSFGQTIMTINCIMRPLFYKSFLKWSWFIGTLQLLKRVSLMSVSQSVDSLMALSRVSKQRCRAELHGKNKERNIKGETKRIILFILPRSIRRAILIPLQMRTLSRRRRDFESHFIIRNSKDFANF